MYLDVRRLEEAKIGLDAKVSLAAQYKSLEEGLTALLKPAGMALQVRDDVLVLTSQDSADSVSDTVVYQLMPPVDFDLLIERVVKVRPTTWAEVGGTGLVKQLSPDLLIVNQTHGIQSEIAAQFAGTLRPTPMSRLRVLKLSRRPWRAHWGYRPRAVLSERRWTTCSKRWAANRSSRSRLTRKLLARPASRPTRRSRASSWRETLHGVELVARTTRADVRA